MHIGTASQNVSLGCGSWNTSTTMWQIEATTSSEMTSPSVLRCHFAYVGSYAAILRPDIADVGAGGAGQGGATVVVKSEKLETVSAMTLALLLLISALFGAMLILCSCCLRASGMKALRPHSCVARRKGETIARASTSFAL